MVYCNTGIIRPCLSVAIASIVFNNTAATGQAKSKANQKLAICVINAGGKKVINDSGEH
jgi:hypothetical protein